MGTHAPGVLGWPQGPHFGTLELRPQLCPTPPTSHNWVTQVCWQNTEELVSLFLSEQLPLPVPWAQSLSLGIFRVAGGEGGGCGDPGGKA